MVNNFARILSRKMIKLPKLGQSLYKNKMGYRKVSSYMLIFFAFELRKSIYNAIDVILLDKILPWFH